MIIMRRNLPGWMISARHFYQLYNVAIWSGRPDARGRGGVPWFAGKREPNDDYSSDSQAHAYFTLIITLQMLKTMHHTFQMLKLIYIISPILPILKNIHKSYLQMLKSVYILLSYPYSNTCGFSSSCILSLQTCIEICLHVIHPIMHHFTMPLIRSERGQNGTQPHLEYICIRKRLWVA